MKKFFLIFLIFLIPLSVVACTPKEAENGVEYRLNWVIADDLEEATLTETVRLVSDGTAVVFNTWANSYREKAKYPAYFSALPKYGGIDIDEVTVNGETAEGTFNDTMEQYKVYNESEAGEPLEITLKCKITVPHGNYRMGLQDGVLKLLNAYPVLAVKEDGAARSDHYCKVGDPFYVEAANYRIQVDAPEDLTVALSADQRKEKTENGRKIIDATINGIRDFALMGSREWQEVTAVAGETLVHYYAKEGKTDRLEVAVSALEKFSDFLGNYPWHQYSVAEAPFYYGGMEYGGFSLIADDATEWEDVVVHETAHQWFYGIVGSDQINHAWMDEGLATFMTNYYLHLKGDSDGYEARRQRDQKLYRNFINLNVLNHPDYDAKLDRPIGHYATNYEDTMLVYYKGGMMFDAVSHLLGAKKMEQGLRAYCKANAYGVATPSSLYEAFKKATGQDIRGIVEPWLNDRVLMESFSYD